MQNDGQKLDEVVNRLKKVLESNDQNKVLAFGDGEYWEMYSYIASNPSLGLETISLNDYNSSCFRVASWQLSSETRYLVVVY